MIFILSYSLCHCVCSYPQRQLRVWLACSPSVSASRKDWLWMLQSNSCNYLQSVDNRGPTKRLLTHKHGGGRDVSRSMEGKISQRKKRKMVAMLVFGGGRKKKIKSWSSSRCVHKSDKKSATAKNPVSKALCCLNILMLLHSKMPFFHPRHSGSIHFIYKLFIKWLYESYIEGLFWS